MSLALGKLVEKVAPESELGFRTPNPRPVAPALTPGRRRKCPITRILAPARSGVREFSPVLKTNEGQGGNEA